jgi:hypothetical protein
MGPHVAPDLPNSWQQGVASFILTGEKRFLPGVTTQAKIFDSITAVHRRTTAVILSFTAIYCRLLQYTAVLLPSTEVLLKFY